MRLPSHTKDGAGSPARPAAAPAPFDVDDAAREAWRRARASELYSRDSFPATADELFILDVGLTYACQCRCSHCAVSRQRSVGPLLSADELEALCVQARREMGAAVVHFSGGEPLLREDVVEVVRRCARHLHVSMSTNGVAFAPPLARELREAGLATILVSLDSTDPAVHDRQRARDGAFDAVLGALALCRELGIDAHLSTCVTKGLVRSGEVDRLAELARREGAKLDLLPLKLAGRVEESEDDLLGEDEMAYLFRLLSREEGRVYVETPDNFHHNAFKCACLRNFLFVNPDGVVQPCPYVFFDFGNVRDTPLPELYRRMFEHPVFSDRSLLNTCLMAEPAFVRRHFGGRVGGELVKPPDGR